MITRVLTLGPPRIRRAPVLENLIVPTILIDCFLINAGITRVSILGSGASARSRPRRCAVAPHPGPRPGPTPDPPRPYPRYHPDLTPIPGGGRAPFRGGGLGP